jgi:hypothetical protein
MSRGFHSIYGRQLVPDEGGADVERVPLHFNNLYRLVFGNALHNRHRRLAGDPLLSSFLLDQIRVGKVNQLILIESGVCRI